MVLSIDFDIRSSGPLYHKRTSLSVVTSSLSTDFTSLSRTVFRVLSRKPLMKQGCIFHDQSVSHRHLPPLSFLDLLEYLLQFLHQNSLFHSELESYGMTAFLKPHGSLFCNSSFHNFFTFINFHRHRMGLISDSLSY